MIFHSTFKKPILLVGNGARNSGSFDLLQLLFDRTKIPILTSINAVDMVNDKNKIGFIGTYGHRVSNVILSECDLIIAIGIRLGLRQIGHNPSLFAPKAKLIRVDIDQNELSRQIKEDEEKILLDAKVFLQLLMNEDIPSYEEWFNQCRNVARLLEGIDDTDGNKVVKLIGTLLPANPIVTVDIGQNMCWVAQSLTLKGSLGRIIIGGSYGAMGVGLPYAIGASIAHHNSIVYCITGDGGLQMNIQELEVLVREKLPIKILIINNHALGKISEIQEKSYNSRYAQTTMDSGYSVPDFSKIATAYGIKATYLENYNELIKFKNWLLDNEPCLIDISIPFDTKLIPKIEFNTMNVLPKIDNKLENYVYNLIKGVNCD